MYVLCPMCGCNMQKNENGILETYDLVRRHERMFVQLIVTNSEPCQTSKLERFAKIVKGSCL